MKIFFCARGGCGVCVCGGDGGGGGGAVWRLGGINKCFTRY